MSERKTIKVFMVHQFKMSDLQRKIAAQLQAFPSCEFIDLSLPEERPLPAGQLEFIQEHACGRMMEADIVMVLPDTEKGCELDEGDVDDYISDFSDPFRSNRGLHAGSVYTVELRTLMFDSCDTQPVLVLGWTKNGAEYLADKLRNPERIGSRAYDRDRFHAMSLDESTGPHDIAARIISILDSQDRKH